MCRSCTTRRRLVAVAVSFCGVAAMAACSASTDLLAYDAAVAEPSDAASDSTVEANVPGPDQWSPDTSAADDGDQDATESDDVTGEESSGRFDASDAADGSTEADGSEADADDGPTDANSSDSESDVADGGTNDADAGADAAAVDAGCTSVDGGVPPGGSPDGGLLSPYGIISMPSATQTVAIGDVNGDGRNDLVAATNTANGAPDPGADYSIFVFLQNACGGLSPPVRYAGKAGDHIQSLAIGDVTGDGRADVVVDQPNAVGVFAQNGGGGLDPIVLYSLPFDPERVAVGDVNGDGRPDVFALRLSEGAELLQSGSGGLAAPTAMTLNTQGVLNDVQIADVTGDGKADVVAIGGLLAVIPQLANGTLGTEVDYTQSVSNALDPLALALEDVTGDGLIDVIATNNGGFVDVYAQDGAGGLLPPVQYTTPDVSGVGIGDFNGDGRNDVVSATWLVDLRLQTAAGTLAPPSQFPAPQLGGTLSRLMAVGDVNSDGQPDVAIVTYPGVALAYGAK